MKTHKTIKKLRLGKETVADLNTREMRLIFGGAFQADDVIFQRITDSCVVCAEPGDEYTISNCPITCGESCH
jgi:natural product precursor